MPPRTLRPLKLPLLPLLMEPLLPLLLVSLVPLVLLGVGVWQPPAMMGQVRW
jgi:hypothetical protein